MNPGMIAIGIHKTKTSFNREPWMKAQSTNGHIFLQYQEYNDVLPTINYYIALKFNRAITV